MRESTEPGPIRILVADDHWVVRQGLELFLGGEPGLTVVVGARDGEEAVRPVAELGPEIILTDILMPGMDGIRATARIRADMPGVEIIALTSVLRDDSVSDAIRAGADLHPLQRGQPPPRVRLRDGRGGEPGPAARRDPVDAAGGPLSYPTLSPSQVLNRRGGGPRCNECPLAARDRHAWPHGTEPAHPADRRVDVPHAR
ncbi:MAG TPA: response regulator transcription factor [Candidatus Dormibacteraeota bacterium]|nr:response regulator transcription factor [Candidatus Dormibacteraeota bacterium]